MSTVSASMAPLAAEYAAVPSPRSADIEEMFTIDPPPPAAMTGMAYFDARNVVRRLMSSARSQSSSEMSTTVPTEARPMLLTSTSTVPNASTARWTIASQSAARVASAWTTRASPPSFSISSFVSSARSAYRSTSTTFAPSRASTTAVALPVPTPGPGVEPAPVTIATLPSTRPALPVMAVLIPRQSLQSCASGSTPPRRQHCGAGLEAAGVADDRDLGAPDLAIARLAAELAHGLGGVPEAGVQPSARELPAPGVEGQLAVEADSPAAVDERAGLAGPAEPERLEPPHVVDHTGHRLDGHRRPQVAGRVGRRHDDGRRTVGRHVAVVEADRGRDHP